MSLLTPFGACAVTVMLISYALEHRVAGWVLVFALACAVSSLYGWLAGTWPFDVVEGVMGAHGPSALDAPTQERPCIVSTPVGQVLTYALIPVVATTVGGIVATIRAPGRRVGSAIEHFAGGVILAAAVVELLPDAMRGHAPGAIVVGFVLAVALTLAVKGRGNSYASRRSRGT